MIAPAGAGNVLKKRINRYSADTGSALPNGVFVAVLLAIGWMVWRTIATPLVAYVPIADYWEYVAVLREWLQNGALGNPHVDAPALSNSFTPYLALLALIARAFGLNAMQALSVGAVLNLLLIAAGVRLFMQAYFRHNWAPAIGLIALFFCWGISWNQLNVHQLGSFLHTASYPATFTFGLSLIAFRLTLQLLGNDALAPVWAGLLAVVTALMLLCDPVTSVFGISGCLLLVLTEPVASRLNQALAVGMLLAGLGLAEVWPYFSPWKVAFGLYEGSDKFVLSAWLEPAARLMSGEWNTVLYNPALVVVTLGLALLGIPLLAALVMRREQAFIVSGALLTLALYLLNLLFPIPDAERFLMFFAVYLQLAIVWGWLRLIDAWSEIPRAALAAPALLVSIAFGAGLIGFNFWMAGMEFDGKRLAPRPVSVIDMRALPDGMSVDELYADLFAEVGEDAVVLSSADDGHALAALGNKVVAIRYVNPLLADRRARYDATDDFFFRPIDELERVEIIQRYDVSHVLVNTKIRKVAERAEPWVAKYGRLLAQRGTYRVYELSPALHDVILPVDEPAQSPPAPATAAAERAVGDTGKTSMESVANTPETAPDRPAESAPVEDSAEPARSFGAPIASPVLDPSRHGG